ncbi:unnamed protein product [Symbiodinium natans]|uniref:J domain-containing protein n=1 Tax=Symbiodinium natans TaxID=878477 RepID=A0A812VEP7_9DINO|nr:unnamed protein product [Symbiodinium natans]
MAKLSYLFLGLCFALFAGVPELGFFAVPKSKKPGRTLFEEDKALLEVDGQISKSMLKTAWRRQVLIHHPDRGGSEESFVRRYQAYERLQVYVEAAETGQLPGQPGHGYESEDFGIDVRVENMRTARMEEEDPRKVYHHDLRKPLAAVLARLSSWDDWEMDDPWWIWLASVGLKFHDRAYLSDRSMQNPELWSKTFRTIQQMHAAYEVRVIDLGTVTLSIDGAQLSLPANLTAICYGGLGAGYQELWKSLVEYDTRRKEMYFKYSLLAQRGLAGFEDKLPQGLPQYFDSGIGWIDYMNNALVCITLRVASVLNVKAPFRLIGEAKL